MPVAEARDWIISHLDDESQRQSTMAFDFDALAAAMHAGWLGSIRVQLAPVLDKKRRLEEMLEAAASPENQRPAKRARVETEAIAD